MISLRTNISSLITQNNMADSTNKLNQAIERMSTGYKINHAGDNAANYSISQNMSVQLSACDIAADNIAMGMDLLQTAQDTIAGMQSRGSRLQALITQARNGTYGADSLAAMTSEANAIMAEINRLYNNTEYNGIRIFDMAGLPEWARTVQAAAGTIGGKSLSQCAAENNGFIAEVDSATPQVIVTDPSQLASAISTKTIIGIGNAETLAELAKIVNGTSDYAAEAMSCNGKTIVLTEDVDISAICAANTDGEGKGGWNPIGNGSNQFRGTFNGNGHKVTGLYINRPNNNSQSLFGYVGGIIKNVGVEGANVTGKDYVGGLVGVTFNDISNCYTTGFVKGVNRAGGIAGDERSNISNSYSTASVIGHQYAGGLSGIVHGTTTNCYATGNVTESTFYTGGLIGYSHAISNSYATGSVTGQGQCTGGLAGETSGTITNSYATGTVTGQDYTGGLVGETYYSITNSYATGDVSGRNCTGGLAGRTVRKSGTMNISNVYTTGNVSGSTKVGSFIGSVWDTDDGTSFGTIDITNVAAQSQGNMIGFEGTDSTAYSSGQMDTWLANIETFTAPAITLQVGINSDSDSQITVSTGLSFNLSIPDLTSDSALTSIEDFLKTLSQKATVIGAAQNRLESALESNLVQMDNLTSSLSTIRDADIGKVSSEYIKQQILQQAAATLMSTANQSPAIALQLL